MPELKLNLGDGPQIGFNTPVPPWDSQGQPGDGLSGETLLIADVDDENGNPTGVSFYIDSGSTTGQNAIVVVADHFGVRKEAWGGYWYSNNNAVFSFRGLPPGATFSLSAAGASGSASRDTNFTVVPSDQGTVLYDNSGNQDNPTQQVVLTGTVPGSGIVTVQASLVDAFAYVNFFILNYSTGAATPPSFTGNIANQVDAEDSPITPLDTAAQFSAGTGTGAVYSSTVLPLGLSLNTSNGQVTGTPTTPGTVSGIVVTLTTSEGSADSNAFSWEITDATSPSLSAPAAGSITSDGVTPIVSTNDTQNGSIWALVELGANPDPDAATIKANGEQLDAPFTAPVIFTPVTGLIPGNDYQISYYQEDQAGNPSNVARVTFQTIAVPNVIVYTVQALPPAGSYSVLDGSGCGIGNQVEVPTAAEGTPITWNLPFDGTFVIQGESPPGYVFEARSRIDNASPWTPLAVFQVNQ